MESRQTKVALQRVKTFQARNRTKSPEIFEMRVDLGHLALLAAAESALDAIADSGELAREGPSMNRDQMHGFFPRDDVNGGRWQSFGPGLRRGIRASDERGSLSPGGAGPDRC